MEWARWPMYGCLESHQRLVHAVPPPGERETFILCGMTGREGRHVNKKAAAPSHPYCNMAKLHRYAIRELRAKHTSLETTITNEDPFPSQRQSHDRYRYQYTRPNPIPRQGPRPLLFKHHTRQREAGAIPGVLKGGRLSPGGGGKALIGCDLRRALQSSMTPSPSNKGGTLAMAAPTVD